MSANFQAFYKNKNIYIFSIFRFWKNLAGGNFIIVGHHCNTSKIERDSLTRYCIILRVFKINQYFYTVVYGFTIFLCPISCNSYIIWSKTNFQENAD